MSIRRLSSAEWNPLHQSAEGQPWGIAAAAGVFHAGGGGMLGRWYRRPEAAAAQGERHRRGGDATAAHELPASIRTETIGGWWSSAHWGAVDK